MKGNGKKEKGMFIPIFSVLLLIFNLCVAVIVVFQGKNSEIISLQREVRVLKIEQQGGELRASLLLPDEDEQRDREPYVTSLIVSAEEEGGPVGGCPSGGCGEDGNDNPPEGRVR